MKYIVLIILIGLSSIALANEERKSSSYLQLTQISEKSMSAVGDTKKEACEDAEWEARKACVRIGRTGLPVNGAQCVSCSPYNTYQFQCTVIYRCN